MQQLSSLDASFLYLESHRTPMHIGGIYIFDAHENNTHFDYFRYKNYLLSRIHAAPMFRQRLVEVPLDLGHPYWVDDPEFDIEKHLLHVALPKPADMNALLNLAAQIFAKPLNRSRPLWDVTIVEGLYGIEGLSDKAFAMIPRIHHAGLDGVSGVHIMKLLFDETPNISAFASLPIQQKQWKPKGLPNSLELFVKNSGNILSTPVQLTKLVTETVGRAIKLNNKNNKLSKVEKAKVPPSPFTAPRTLFNVPVTAHRIVSVTSIELETVKQVKNHIKGCTVNDVILSICSGGLRKYLLEKSALPEKSLVAMAPVSVRVPKETGEMGNKISAMAVSLHTQQAKPIERLKAIHAHAVQSKSYSKAVKANKLMDYVPAQIAASAARLYTRLKIAKIHRPVYNLIITNVPGPPKPLYMNGYKLGLNFGIAPLIDGLGLIITIFSYNGTMYIGATSCREIMPDLSKLTVYIKQELEELMQAFKQHTS